MRNGFELEESSDFCGTLVVAILGSTPFHFLNQAAQHVRGRRAHLSQECREPKLHQVMCRNFSPLLHQDRPDGAFAGSELEVTEFGLEQEPRHGGNTLWTDQIKDSEKHSKTSKPPVPERALRRPSAWSLARS